MKKTRRKLSSERRWERSLLYLKQRKAKFYVFLDLLINSLISVNKYKYHNLIRIHQDAQEEGYYMRPLEKGFWFVAEALLSIFTHSGAATDARRCHPLGRNRSSWTAPRQSQWQCRRTRSRASPLTLTSGDYLGQYICDDLTFSTRIFEWSQEKVRATRKPGTWTTSQSVSISTMGEQAGITCESGHCCTSQWRNNRCFCR